MDEVVVQKAELLPRARALALQIAAGTRSFKRTLQLTEQLQPVEMAQAVLGKAREMVRVFCYILEILFHSCE